MSAFSEPNTSSIFYQLGFDTDIGGGRENQDDYFVWKSADSSILVLCVLDGHGREVGKIAANAAHASLKEYFEGNHHILRMNPYDCLVAAHEYAHNKIKLGFREELEREGYEVEEAPEGYLLKRMPSSAVWGCVHGGSSCSIVAIVDHMMYIANVGDSSGTLSSTVASLGSAMLQHMGDAAAHSTAATGGSHNVLPATLITDPTAMQDTLVITAEHSPESPSEFCRLRAFRAKPGDPMQPALAVVYDSPSVDKTNCAPVFSIDEAGVPTVLNKGKYYKNVRKEWASLVSTPTTARFQDALAFTRSLGDLHLHTFGVTHLPEVHMVDLRQVFAKTAQLNSKEKSDSIVPPEGGATRASPDLVCLVLATDGVWDNWTYEDVTRFVMDSSCMSAAMAGTDGAQRVATAFMQRNAVYAKRNFGGQADNATGIVVYISCSSSLPH